MVLLALDGAILCYAELEAENAAEILSRLDFERLESATVQLTTRADGSKCVTGWKSWGLDRVEPGAGLPDKSVAFSRD